MSFKEGYAMNESFLDSSLYSISNLRRDIIVVNTSPLSDHRSYLLNTETFLTSVGKYFQYFQYFQT